MRNRTFRPLCWLMSVLLCLQLVPTQAYAYPQPKTVEGTYGFTMTRSGCKQATDSFAFYEDCFMRSSFYGCTHLAELSAQVALASVGWYGNPSDPYADAVDDTGHNIKQMLTSMGFADVQTNAYYSSDTLPDSIGVAIGRRPITVGDKTYTLLAVSIRSADYKREWMGNFHIGSGGMVQGFLEARDEALRFIKKYVSDHGIANDLKVWVSGHSRGAAVANMVGGFLAGGGTAYLGSSVSIDPKNVYCYCFATPVTIKPGLSKSTELSVSAARGGAYAKDTPGKAYVSKATGTLDPTNASIYGGIHTYQNESDFIPLLPPASWGFARYGTSHPIDGSVVSAESMAAELANINDELYQKYVNGGASSAFAPVKPNVLGLDLNNPSLDGIELVSAAGQGDKDLRQFLERRAAGLAKDEPTNADYVSRGYEDTLCSAAGLITLANSRVIDGGIASALQADADNNLVSSALYGYLAYATNQLIAEKRAKTEAEACAIVVGDLLSYVYGSKVTISTDDDFLKALGKLIGKHQNTPLVQSLLDKITAAVPEDKASLLMLLLYSYQPKGVVQVQSNDELELPVVVQDAEDDIELVDDMAPEPVVDVQGSLDNPEPTGELSDDELYQLGQIVAETIVNLRDQGTATTDDGLDIGVTTQADDTQKLRQTLANFLIALGSDSSASARNTVYTILPLVSGSLDIDFGSPKATTPFAQTLGEVLPSLLKKDDGTSYASLDDASTARLATGLEAIAPTIVKGARSAYGDSYANELAGYLNTLATHPAQLKTLLFNTLFGAVNYSFTYHVVTLATLLNSKEIFVVTHADEQYLAWMRAVRKAVNEGTHTIYHSVAITAEPAAGGTASANISEAAADANVTLAAKAAKGYSFTGWTAISPKKLAIKSNGFAMPDANVRVRANFKANSYAVAFKANGGKGSTAKQSFLYGTKQALVANAFTRSGYSFAGWNTKADGSGKAYSNKQTVKNLSSKNGATVTLYAQWTKDVVPSTRVAARMQRLGWLKAVTKGSVAGQTEGKLRLEALKISLSKSNVTGGIEYRSHLFGKDWQSTWTRNGKSCGISKTSQHLDAVQVRLYGNMKKKFDVYYRVYVQGYGWMGWAKNGQKAGTTGMDRRVGAIQVLIKAKGAKAPSKTLKGATQSYAKAFVAK